MNLAGWGTRVAASLIDALVVLPFLALAWILDRPTVDATTGDMTGGGPIFWGLYLVAALVGAYNRWYLQGKTGRSWGKKTLGIKLVGEATGQPIGPLMAFVRELAHTIDGIICGIGYLFPLWDAKKQTIADKLVTTLVTKD
ncbi:MAG TPA: RDD family protein [Micromonosporaceae bacterium]|nr:RDD family protein [Micromonosporaceae bacterium]